MLAASILVRYDTMEIFAYVEPGSEVQTAAEFVNHACDVAQSLDLALPTPDRIQWGKQLPNGAVLPDESKASYRKRRLSANRSGLSQGGSSEDQ